MITEIVIGVLCFTLGFGFEQLYLWVLGRMKNMNEAKRKKKNSQFPSYMSMLLVFLFGLSLRGPLDAVTGVYFSGFLTVFVMPFLIVQYEGRGEMKRTEALVRSLQGG